MSDTGQKSARSLGSLRHSAYIIRKDSGINKSWHMEFPSNSPVCLNQDGVTQSPTTDIQCKRNDQKLKLRFTGKSSRDESGVLQPIYGMQFRALSNVAAVTDKDHSSRPVSTGDSFDHKDHGHFNSAKSSIKPNYRYQMQWNLRENYLDEGDFVKGKGHRIDTGPLSRPVSGWSNREFKNAVELASECRDDDEPERYYSLDVDSGTALARHLNSGTNVIIGINGKERPTQRTADEEDEDLGDVHHHLALNHIPLSWEDQLVKPMVKVVQPRLLNSETSTWVQNASETKPVVFQTGLFRDAFPTTVTKLQIFGKENSLPLGFKRGFKNNSKQKRETLRNVDDIFQPEFSKQNFDDVAPLPLNKHEHNKSPRSNKLPYNCHRIIWSGSSLEKAKHLPSFTRSTSKHSATTSGDMVVVGNGRDSSAQKEKSTDRITPDKNLLTPQKNESKSTQELGKLGQRTKSLINIVQKIEIKPSFVGESGDAEDKTANTSYQRRKSPLRLRYSVRDPQAVTAVKRSRSEGIFKGTAGSKSASMQGRTREMHKESSSLDLEACGLDPLHVLSGERMPNSQKMANARISEEIEPQNPDRMIKKEEDVNAMKPMETVRPPADSRLDGEPSESQETDNDEIGETEILDSEADGAAPPPSRAATLKAGNTSILRNTAHPEFISFEEIRRQKGSGVAGFLHIPTAAEDDVSRGDSQTRCSEEINDEVQENNSLPDFDTTNEKMVDTQRDLTPFSELTETPFKEDYQEVEEEEE